MAALMPKFQFTGNETEYEILIQFIAETMHELNEKLDTILNRLSSIELEMAQLKTQMNHMDKRIDRLEKEMDGHEQDIRSLTKFMWTAIGGLATLQVVITVLLQLFGH